MSKSKAQTTNRSSNVASHEATAHAQQAGQRHGKFVKQSTTKLAERVGTVVLAGAGIAAIGVGAAWTYGKFFARSMRG